MGGLESFADRMDGESIKGQWRGGGDSGQEELKRVRKDISQLCRYDLCYYKGLL